MKVLVTGARGFIGSYLTEELAHAGHAVVGIDRSDGDLTIPRVFDEILRKAEAEQVVHLAAQVGRLSNEDSHRWSIQCNTIMTSIVARCCARHEVPLTYVSTSEVYGDHGWAWCDERTPLTGAPSGIYALTKRWGEELCQLYAPKGLRIIRPTMPYGPGVPPGRGRRAIDNFLWWAHHAQPIVVHAGSERSWCHVRDVVRGMRLVIEGPVGIYNVGRDDDRRPMLEVAAIACSLAGQPLTLIQVVDPPAMQTIVKRLSTVKLARLGFVPAVPFEDGMAELYDWIKLFDINGIKAGSSRSLPF